MKIKRVFVMVVILLVGFISSSKAQEHQSTVIDKVKWQHGPCISSLANEAEIRVPAGFVFANAADTKLLMEEMHNIPSDSEIGFVAPSTLEWFLVFEFSDSGYIKDDEKGSLDADTMFTSLKAANAAGNKEKQKRGWETFELTGWQLPPRYNEETHNLEWATKFDSKDGTTVNWNTRLLGRDGVMSVVLVSSEEKLQDILPQFNNVLKGYSYKSGHRYAEFRRGDKIAKYGLTALVLGGAATVAAKAGLFKYIGKFFIFIFAAIAAFFKGVWEKLKGVWEKITKKKE